MKYNLQAVMASDFSLPQFRFLERLLIVHGHWCYKRISKMVNFYLSDTQMNIPGSLTSRFGYLPLNVGSLFCIQEHCIWPHLVLLRIIHKFLRRGLIWWLVYGNVQCNVDILTGYIIRSLWAGCFLRCMPPGKEIWWCVHTLIHTNVHF